MAKTWLSVYTAFGLVTFSVALFLTRRSTLGSEIQGPPGWQVTLTVEGELRPKEGTLITARPPDFRHQHISKEELQSRELRHRLARKRKSGERQVIWHRLSMSEPEGPYRAVYSFRCTMGRPTPAMVRLTDRLDAAPIGDQYLKPGVELDKEYERLFAETLKRVPADRPPAEQVQGFVGALSGAVVTDSRSRSRLLMALCHARHFPARLVSGLFLAPGSDQPLHWWAEVWVPDHWLPVCPTHRYFGADQFPEHTLVLQLGDREPVRGHGVRSFQLLVQGIPDLGGAPADSPPSPVKAFWRKTSFYWLRPSEQSLVKFLLLLPVAALIVSLFRTVVGITTFGTFGPALFGLAFRDLRALPWGLLILVLTILVSWGIRRLLDRFHLLHVPRVAVMLTLIVMFLIGLIVVASRFGVTTTQYIALFPLVILTHLVERFWTVEAEDGTPASFQTLLGTFAVAVVISLTLSPPAVADWLFRYPETLGLVLAAQLLLGRYTGYRLSELYRFSDLLQERQTPGGTT